MSFRPSTSAALISSLLLATAAAACGGIAPSAPGDPSPSPRTDDPSRIAIPAPGDPSGPPTPSRPSQPVGPYTGVVATTDVSILYPLPLGAGSRDFVRPTEAGAHGALLTKSALDTVLGGRTLDRTSAGPAGYDTLGLVSVRLDPCSARGSVGGKVACRSEVRLVFQALYEKTADAVDPSVGSAATDGAVHVVYDVPDVELVTMLRQILTLKKANGDLALQELAPHPILAAQGLGGAFAQGLRDIVLEHVGDDRIGRITFFDHQNDEFDAWTFGVFDRTIPGAGTPLTASTIATIDAQTQTFAGSSTTGPLASSFAEAASQASSVDSVAALVDSARPPPGSATVASLQPSLDATLRVQNPALHNVETTDCVNCHLAEGARLLGEGVYALSTANAFTHARSLARVDQRTSVTNVHAFGYLGRQVSIMQRTANESVLAADMMAVEISPPK